ncbi:Hypothetical protein GLP15_1323 [Giardia lamblia P15]|uniref:Uncharacterized protein n=1 Tax=Giardia intestinalis (strain P15) TaxID=658858 RepID=E1F882_GIAIA|nr:Hypothetical protein GLP15_1323 [Giardia lamblia P15]
MLVRVNLQLSECYQVFLVSRKMASWFKTGVTSPGPAAYYIRREFDSKGAHVENELGLLTNPLLSSRSPTVNLLNRSQSPVNLIHSERRSPEHKDLSLKKGMKGSLLSSPWLETYRSTSPPAKEITSSRNIRRSPATQIVYNVTPCRQAQGRATSPLYHSGSLSIPHIRSHSPLQESRFVPTTQRTQLALSASSIRLSKPHTGPAFSIKGREIMWREAWGAMLKTAPSHL